MITPYKNRTINLDKPVRVYRCLSCQSPVDMATDRQSPVYSILQGGLVVGHADRLVIQESKFVCLPGAMAQSRKLGHKVVCAFVEGKLDVSGTIVPAKTSSKLRFNLDRGGFCDTDKPDAGICHSAPTAYLSMLGLAAQHPIQYGPT